MRWEVINGCHGIAASQWLGRRDIHFILARPPPPYDGRQEVALMKREIRRTSAQFLNGLAIAILAAGVIAPAASGSIRLPMVLASGLAGLLLHGLALLVIGEGKR
ncbi:MAG: hypothetical protein ABS75_28955 [Pelagibacterium sp. SCN 63-23]|nr:MAG: hypothetical protein ABS75_28955 [Pelagibacterium sp. SCN 63-23]